MKTYLNRASKDDVPFNPIKWKNLAWSNCLISIRAHFILKEHIQRGTPLIAAGEKNNGIMRMTNLPAVFPANTITVGKAQLTVFINLNLLLHLMMPLSFSQNSNVISILVYLCVQL